MSIERSSAARRVVKVLAILLIQMNHDYFRAKRIGVHTSCTPYFITPHSPLACFLYFLRSVSSTPLFYFSVCGMVSSQFFLAAGASFQTARPSYIRVTTQSMQTSQFAQSKSTAYFLRPLRNKFCTILVVCYCIGARKICIVRIKHVIRKVWANFAALLGL